MKNKKEFEKVLALLPQRLAYAINLICDTLDDECVINEIRLRRDRPCSLTVDAENVILETRCTHSEIKGAVLALCGGSPYAYSDTIQKGYIVQKDGIRCGVCPNFKSGASVDEITSLCIRLPWELEYAPGIADICKTDNKVVSTLLFSPPGVGKTTVLRLLIKELCAGKAPLRAAVIDTKHELYTARSSLGTLTDYLFGFSKGEGIELALRNLSPEVIFCDEIGAKNDADSILENVNTGVPLIASAHADSFEKLLLRPQIKRLYDNNVFQKYVLIEREELKNRYKFTVSK